MSLFTLLSCALRQLALAGLGFVLVSKLWAGVAYAGEYATIAQLGVIMFTGNTGSNNFESSMGYTLNFRAETRKGYFRRTGALILEFSPAKANITETKYSSQLTGVGTDPGWSFFFFQGARFQPYLGGGGLLMWHILKMGSPPENTEGSTQGLSYGYYVAGGVDIRLGNVEGTAFRISGAYTWMNGTLAEKSFLIQGFRLMLGLSWP